MSNAMSGLEDLRYFLTDGAEITVAHPGERGSVTIGPITTRHIMADLDEVLGEERGSVSPKRMTLTEALAHMAAGPVTKKAASTGPLDELRRAINRNANTSMDALDRFTEVTRRKAHEKDIAALDAYEAAHPGLVDLTVCGPQCPAWHEDGQDGDSCWCWAMVQYAPTGSPCPVIERCVMLPEVEAYKRTRTKSLADAAIAALEAGSLNKERCGNCKYGTNRYSHARFWVANCGAGLHPNGFVRAHDRCHFITPEHPHGRWELCDE